jgi:RNA-directed DNA polymerase
MTHPSAPLDDLVHAIVRIDVKWMSSKVLGMPYDEVKGLIYPTPPYKLFIIRKRDGSPRVLAEPRRSLKILQQRALEYLKTYASPFRPPVHGFVEGRSILTNANQHCLPTQHHLLNIDLQNFFPSITFYRVRGVLKKHPFHLSHEVATVIAHLCTLDGVLPQGAPTSPFLANLVCRGLDRDLTDLARRYRAKYTRYADDITFSFNVRSAERLPTAVCSIQDGALSVGPELTEIISNHSFTINPAKTRLQGRYKRMEVTGLTINQFPNVRRRFIDKIRGALHAWEKFGYDLAAHEWQRRVLDTSIAWDSKPWKRQTRTRKTPELKNVLWGKLLYLRMVRGPEDVLYARLADRYNAAVRITSSQGNFAAPMLPVEFLH